MTVISEEDHNALMHFGILRKSGRYPWGSGKDVETRSRDFLGTVKDLKRQGLTDSEIMRGFGMNSSEFRAARSIAIAKKRAADIAMAERLAEKGYSNKAIAERMGLPNESSVRALRAPGVKDRVDVLQATANMLKSQIDEKKYLDVGSGVETHIGISSTKLKTAIAMLKEEGYTEHQFKIPQLGNPGKFTNVKILAPPGVTRAEAFANRGDIKQITDFSEDHGRSFLGVHPPISIDSSRIGIRYAEQGGDALDGVIYVRPGVKDVSLGKSPYAQVRIAVDGTHYIKGMAIYKDDLPKGVDLVFNTNKSNTGNKLDAMKAMKDEPANPFGSTIHQIIEKDSNGKERVTSAMNIVGSKEGLGEAGSWDRWKTTLSSQMVSKQSPEFAKTQLAARYDSKKEELDEIMSLTNPAVRRKLLESFADEADASAVHLEAAALPRTASRVILPLTTIKENEIYAPRFNNGERVVLIRHPHAGPFEIPELIVNNRNQEGRKLLGTGVTLDAVGIHANVAKKLSGADFDGDAVLVIPNNLGKIKTAPSLEGLKDFDPIHAFPAYDGMTTIDGGTYHAATRSVDYHGQQPKGSTKQKEMGKITNLIADMSIKGADNEELARAVRHSMVVIDSEKHNLNYKQSAIDNGINQLKIKYQPNKQGGPGGASTLITKAGAEARPEMRRLRRASEGGPIDPATGRKVYVPTGETYVNRAGKRVPRTFKSKKLAETEDAFSLSSGSRMETVYAEHSNKLKALANDARKAYVATKPVHYSPSAKQAYSKEVASLESKLNIAIRNRPLERQAQILAAARVRSMLHDNPEMDEETKKKIRNQSLAEMRRRTGAGKKRIEITDSEWAAIQAGAITNHKLVEILKNADLDRVKKLATPKTAVLMTTTKKSRAKQMLKLGYTEAEVASALGVSRSTLMASIGGE